MDRGFLFGDGVYEVIPAYGGRLFRLEQHLQRLTRSLQGIRMQNPLPLSQWSALLNRLISQHGKVDQNVYVQVTRGAHEKRDHALPTDIPPTLFAMSQPPTPLSAPALAQGISAITRDDIRWQMCHIKAVTLLANVLLRAEANDNDAMESILVREGKVTEGAASNLFLVSAELLITPPDGPLLLPGITRDLVLELAESNGIAHAERDIKEAELGIADEIWLTSSTKEIMPVTRLNGNPVGTGRPGRLWGRLYRLFQDYKLQHCCT
jgi:D-alanine transaminase